MRWKSELAVFLLLVCAVQLASGQNRPPQPPAFDSVSIADDKSVLIKVWAPNSEKVRLSSGDLAASSPIPNNGEMTKGENGVWEIKVGPVQPGSYRYQFSIDGLTFTDPRNPASSESNMNSWSLLTVPGSEYSDLNDVAHGTVGVWHYQSKTLNRQRRVHVYTPPGYESGDQTYPVLYLLHGASDSDASWSTVGKAGLVLDNLIANRKATPMIVVMPMGHTGAFSFGPNGGNFMKQMEEFHDDFVKDLRPAVESRYRVSNKREHRAVAGLSMGGAQSINIAMAQLQDFAYVGVFSSGVFGIDNPNGAAGPDGKSWEERNAAVLDDPKLKEGLRLFWFATGKEDFLLKTTQKTVEVLKNHKFDVTYHETDGGHTWIKWREHYLPEFAQLLFK